MHPTRVVAAVPGCVFAVSGAWRGQAPAPGAGCPVRPGVSAPGPARAPADGTLAKAPTAVIRGRVSRWKPMGDPPGQVRSPRCGHRHLLRETRAVATDEQGRYASPTCRAGRYTIAASDCYVTNAGSARRRTPLPALSNSRIPSRSTRSTSACRAVALPWSRSSIRWGSRSRVCRWTCYGHASSTARER